MYKRISPVFIFNNKIKIYMNKFTYSLTVRTQKLTCHEIKINIVHVDNKWTGFMAALTRQN